MTDLYLSSIGFKIARTSGNVARLLATLKIRPAQECQNTFGNVARLLATFFLSNCYGLTPKTGQECQNSLSQGARRVPQVAATSLLQTVDNADKVALLLQDRLAAGDTIAEAGLQRTAEDTRNSLNFRHQK